MGTQGKATSASRCARAANLWRRALFKGPARTRRRSCDCKGRCNKPSVITLASTASAAASIFYSPDLCYGPRTSIRLETAYALLVKTGKKKKKKKKIRLSNSL